MQKKQSDSEQEKFKEAVLLLNAKTQKFKEIKAKYEKIKEECVLTIDNYFNKHKAEKTASFNIMSLEDFGYTNVRVNKVQKSTVNFIPEKVEEAIGKELSSDVIIKSYTINDMQGLINYLKECDVDPNIFKEFVDVRKGIDTQELERLEAIGKISKEQLEDCYTVEKAKPYYTIKTGKRQGDND